MFSNPTPRHLPTFEAEGHLYYNTAKVQIPSVSFLLSHFGLNDYSKVDGMVIERATSFGTAVHETCQHIDKGTFDTLPDWWMLSEWPKVQGYCDQWQEYRMNKRKVFHIIEQPLYSKVWGFAGTPDRCDEVELVDIKTGAECCWHSIQTAFYKILLEENYSLRLKKRGTVYLTADKWRYVEHKNKGDISIAKSLIQIYNWKKNNKIRME